MKMVAAAKLRRSHDAILAARPYAKSMADMTARVAAGSSGDDHPLLERRPGRRIAMVVLTSDRGLCGGFNSNLCRTAQRYAEEKSVAKAIDECRFEVVGRKGRDYFRPAKEIPFPTNRPPAKVTSTPSPSARPTLTRAVLLPGLNRSPRLSLFLCADGWDQPLAVSPRFLRGGCLTPSG